MINDLTHLYQEHEQCSFNSLTVEQQRAIVDHEKIYYQGGVYDGWTYISEVIPENERNGTGAIYIGGMEAVVDSNCKDYNINRILNMADDVIYDDDIPGVNMFRIGIPDGELSPKGVWIGAAQVIDDCVRLRGDDVGGNVIVHCRAGISRSVTAVIAYLMIYRKMGWSQSYRLIRSKRPCVYPHPILMRGLVRDLGSNFIP